MIRLHMSTDPLIALCGGVAGKAGGDMVVLLPTGGSCRALLVVLCELLTDTELASLDLSMLFTLVA